MIDSLFYLHRDTEVPPLLLRDDESAQRAVAMRAAQVLSMQVCLGGYINFSVLLIYFAL